MSAVFSRGWLIPIEDTLWLLVELGVLTDVAVTDHGRGLGFAEVNPVATVADAVGPCWGLVGLTVVALIAPLVGYRLVGRDTQPLVPLVVGSMCVWRRPRVRH